jgi:hypothetical protein
MLSTECTEFQNILPEISGLKNMHSAIFLLTSRFPEEEDYYSLRMVAGGDECYLAAWRSDAGFFFYSWYLAVFLHGRFEPSRAPTVQKMR